MKLLFLSDAYMRDGSFDPFRTELLNSLSLYSSNTLAVTTNHYLHDNSCNPRLFCGFSSILKRINQFKPDIVFTINRAGITPQVLKILPSNCLIITWFIDSYERTNNSLLKFSHNDIVWLTGKGTYEQFFLTNHGKGCSKIISVPFASNTNIFTPKNKERIIDGCFVGTAFSNTAFINLLNDLCDDEEQRGIFLKTLNIHKNKYISDIKLFLQDNGFKKSCKKNRDVWQSIFDDQISLEKRINYLSILDNFKLFIYGEPNDLWIKSFTISNSNMLSRYQYKSIKTPGELSNLYNISKIGINIQHHQASTHSLPIRVFDLMACKTLLMTEKSSTEALNQLGFLEDIDFVTFDTYRELKEKFSYYIHNSEHRNKIAESAYYKVLKYHDLNFRIYSSLKQSLVSSSVLIKDENINIQQCCNPIGLKVSNKVVFFLKYIKKTGEEIFKTYAH
jgi:spore maturation protein CgeB